MCSSQRVLADARSATFNATAPLALVLADARSLALLASAPSPPVLADAPSLALLACIPSSLVLAVAILGVYFGVSLRDLFDVSRFHPGGTSLDFSGRVLFCVGARRADRIPNRAPNVCAFLDRAGLPCTFGL